MESEQLSNFSDTKFYRAAALQVSQTLRDFCS